jgi:esterase/lipase superfamily enzyme
MLVLAALLFGCAASYDDPYFVHSVYRPADASDVQRPVYFVTDRRAEAPVPPGFGFKRSVVASCGLAQVNIPRARLRTIDPAVFATENISAREKLTCGGDQSDIAAQIADAARKANCNRVLVFVHGFDTGFETSVLRAGQLAIDTQWNCVVANFSWSSSGDRLKYAEDSARAKAAEPLFGDFLRALAAKGLTPEIVAHSMGTKLVLETLGQPGAHADQVVFASPDIGIGDDNDEFSALAQRATPNFNRLTVYASRQDAVLAISQDLNNGAARLGHTPSVTAPAKVNIIDASDVPGDYTGHNYYGLAYEIVADIALTLNDVPEEARLQTRSGAEPTLLPGEDGGPNRLNVAEDRRPDIFRRFLRWVASNIPI